MPLVSPSVFAGGIRGGGLGTNLFNQGALSEGNLMLQRLYEDNGMNGLDPNFANLGQSYMAINHQTANVPAALHAMSDKVGLMKAQLTLNELRKQQAFAMINN